MKNFILEFNQDQLNVLNKALIEMPFKISAPIIQHINIQIQHQFEKSNDEKDMPTGASLKRDEFSGD